MPSSACDWSSDVCSSDRSEEHTSELQSRSDLVCRLLLEKKKHTAGHQKQLPPQIHLGQDERDLLSTLTGSHRHFLDLPASALSHTSGSTSAAAPASTVTP